MQQSTKITGVLIAMLGVICFSTKSVFIKLSYQYGIDTISLLSLRMLFSLPFYLAFLIWKWPEIKLLTAKTFGLLIGLGLVGYYLASWLDFKGLFYISASLERLILFCYPTFVVILSLFIFKKKITLYQVLALILTYIGIAIIVFFNNKAILNDSSNYYLGIALVLLSAFVYATYLVVGGRLISKIGAIVFTTLAMLCSTVGVLIHKLVVSGQNILEYPMPVYKYSLIMAIMATVVPSFLISEGIKRIGASNTAIVGGVGPVSTIVLAYFFLGETINTYQIGGTILVMIGVLTITLPAKKSA